MSKKIKRPKFIDEIFTNEIIIRLRNQDFKESEFLEQINSQLERNYNKDSKSKKRKEYIKFCHPGITEISESFLETYKIKNALTFKRYFIKRETYRISNLSRAAIFLMLDYPANQWNHRIELWKNWEKHYQNKKIKSGDTHFEFPRFPLHFEKIERKELTFFNEMRGIWSIYIKNKKNEIFRTFLNVFDEDQVSYLSVHKKDLLMHGRISALSSHRFVISLKTESADRDFLISGRLDEKMINEKGIMISASGTVFTGKQIQSSPIILYKKNIAKKNYKNLTETVKDWGKLTKIDSENLLEQQIATYLNQKTPFHTNYFPQNHDSSIEQLNRRYLAKTGKNRYKYLKDKLSKKDWISFSRIIDHPNKIASYQWSFKFDDVTQTCRVIRISKYETGSTKYTGIGRLFKGHFWVTLRGESSLKFFVARERDFKTQEDFVIFGLSSSLYNNKQAHMVKEILIDKSRVNGEALFKDDHLEEKRTLSYTDFLTKTNIPNACKMHLANRNESILTYSNDQMTGTPMNRRYEGAKYHGEYFIYLNNLYLSKQKIKSKKMPEFLFRACVTIDRLGMVTLKKAYHNDNTYENIPYKHLNEQVYYGTAEHHNRILRMVLGHYPKEIKNYNDSDENLRQFCEIKLLADYYNKDLFVGIQSDSDLYQLPYSAPCIFVKHKELEKILGKKMEYSGRTIPFSDNSDELKAIFELMKLNYENQFQQDFNVPLNSLRQFFDLIDGTYFNNYEGKIRN